MRILGLDTATRRASVGLLIDGEIRAERDGIARENHAVALLPLIDAVLRAGGCAAAELDAVAVSAGPGSFTGLRIGMSVAKGLVYATGARLVGVPTLAALARTISDREGALCTALDARKGELYAACFRVSSRQCQRLGPDQLITLEHLIAQLPTPCTLLGDAEPRYGAVLRQRLGDAITLLPYEQYGPRGATVARLGLEILRSGGGDDPLSLEPRYVRPPDAELVAISS